METKKQEEKKGIEFIRKNWFILLMVTVGILSTWFAIKGHLGNDTIHIQPTERALREGERTLTEEQRENFIKFITLADELLPKTKINEGNINKILTIEAVNSNNYKHLLDRINKIEREISKLHD